MKQKDIALLMIIIFVGGLIAFIVTNQFVVPNKKEDRVEVITPINSSFDVSALDSIDSDTAINPTVTIRIQDQDKSSPFNIGSNESSTD